MSIYSREHFIREDLEINIRMICKVRSSKFDFLRWNYIRNEVTLGIQFKISFSYQNLFLNLNTFNQNLLFWLFRFCDLFFFVWTIRLRLFPQKCSSIFKNMWAVVVRSTKYPLKKGDKVFVINSKVVNENLICNPTKLLDV